MTIVKPNIGPHSGQVNNPLAFEDAYSLAGAAPNDVYRTRGGKAFQVVATVGQKGAHANERVLRFMDGTTERARAYADCWGHITNCNSQHIDIYSEAIRPSPSSNGMPGGVC